MGPYAYDSIDAALVRERAEVFRGQVARRLEGSLTEDEFKPLRLMNGLYLQLHAYMLRVAIPYGVLSGAQLRTLAEVSERFDKGYGHFTTRTNIQFHWVRLTDAPQILDLLADAGLHAIQTSGNCIRNTTTDPFAGAVAGEADDPRVWCELIRQWSTFHPEFTYLPRKFKIAVTASAADRTAARAHDIGLRFHRGPGGALLVEVMVGGGMGRTPALAPTLRGDLPAERLLSYLTAILRVYNRVGRRDNLYKARIKILVASLGAEAFAREVDAEFDLICGEGGVDAPPEEIERIRAAFGATAPDPRPAAAPDVARRLCEDPAFARFVRRNVAPHRVQGRRIVSIALKTPGAVPGDCSAAQMRALADLADRCSSGEIRVTHAQNLVLPHVALEDLPLVFDVLRELDLAAPNIDLISDIIACPGLDYCALANARSINIAQALAQRFSDPQTAEDLGELKIKISGCINACGHHHVGHIGILGLERAGEETYQITLGGSGDENASIGQLTGPGFSSERVVEAIDTIVETYKAQRADAGEPFLATFRRVGMAPFKEALYERSAGSDI